jgi:hypothetical protein
MLIEVLVIYVFQIQRIVLIFVAKIKQNESFVVYLKYLLEQVIIHFSLIVVYYEDFELNDDVYPLIVLLDDDVGHFLRFQTKRKSINHHKSFCFFLSLPF